MCLGTCPGAVHRGDRASLRRTGQASTPAPPDSPRPPATCLPTGAREHAPVAAPGTRRLPPPTRPAKEWALPSQPATRQPQRPRTAAPCGWPGRRRGNPSLDDPYAGALFWKTSLNGSRSGAMDLRRGPVYSPGQPIRLPFLDLRYQTRCEFFLPPPPAPRRHRGGHAPHGVSACPRSSARSYRFRPSTKWLT